CRLFAGQVTPKSESTDKSSRALGRRSSSVASLDQLGFDLSDLMSDFERNACYQRIFRRDGCTGGNLLVQDSQFMDAVRCFIENGGLPRKVVLPNIVKWRHMLQSAARGDEPYNLFEEVRIVDAQWLECCMCLPNSKFPKYSFSCVYYDATIKIDSEKLSHKALRVVQPKQDIAAVFERQIIMNDKGFFLFYLCVCVYVLLKDVKDSALHALVTNIHKYVDSVAKKLITKCEELPWACTTRICIPNAIFFDLQRTTIHGMWGFVTLEKDKNRAIQNKIARYRRKQDYSPLEEEDEKPTSHNWQNSNQHPDDEKEEKFFFYYNDNEDNYNHMYGYYDYYNYEEDYYDDDEHYHQENEEDDDDFYGW
ncbi:nucleolar RNA-binding protein, partial [Reticulomyxa filosa]